MERRGRQRLTAQDRAMAKQLEEYGSVELAQLDDQLLEELRQGITLRQLQPEHLQLLAGTERVDCESGQVWLSAEAVSPFFCVLLEGELVITKFHGDREVHFATHKAGDTFGEVPLLMGMRNMNSKGVATARSRILRIPEEGFWKLMAASPGVREAILADYTRRYETYQAMALHREKLISLGTLAAGLMHELNNPGAAARRASAQLRDNMTRLQQISLRMTRSHLSGEQLDCLANLQEQVFSLQRPASLSSLEQSDREDELSEWLESMQVENPWRLAPTMVSAGWTREDIACASHSFPPGILSDALNYLDALISSMHHVNTVEESIARVTDLVVAVKKYAYDDKNRQQRVDVRDSVLSTLTILGHKFRQKGIQVERNLPSAETKISCVGAGLAQVWTNLLDNAIDAAPENGAIGVRLWAEGDSVCVGIRDNGPGIPPEHWDHLFEPFYTTKEAGMGTGLGLDIAHRIVSGNFGGDIRFTTDAKGTEFIVRLPMGNVAATEPDGCSIAIS